MSLKKNDYKCNSYMIKERGGREDKKNVFILDGLLAHHLILKALEAVDKEQNIIHFFVDGHFVLGIQR